MYSKLTIFISILIIFFLAPKFSSGQSFAIESLQENFLKVNKENYLKIVSNSVACDSIILEADAEVKYNGNCIWVVTPLRLHKPFSFEINLFEKRLKDTIKIGRTIYRTERLDPLGIDFKFKKSMTKEELLNIGAITTFETYATYSHHNSKVKSFKALALRNNEVLFYHNNEEYKFDKKFKNKIMELKKSDELHFFDIKNLERDSLYLNPKSFILKIKDSK